MDHQYALIKAQPGQTDGGRETQKRERRYL